MGSEMHKDGFCKSKFPNDWHSAWHGAASQDRMTPGLIQVFQSRRKILTLSLSAIVRKSSSNTDKVLAGRLFFSPPPHTPHPPTPLPLHTPPPNPRSLSDGKRML